MSGTTNIPSVYLIMKRHNKVLFVLRQNTGYQDGNYGLVAGRVEAGESYKSAAAREALEEVGAKVDPNMLKHVHTMHRYQSPEDIRVDVFFETDEWQGEVGNKEPEKHSEIAWIEIDNLPKNVQDYTAYALKQIQKNKPYSEFGW